MMASGEVIVEDEEQNEKFILPPDMLTGRRLSCF